MSTSAGSTPGPTAGPGGSDHTTTVRPTRVAWTTLAVALVSVAALVWTGTADVAWGPGPREASDAAVATGSEDLPLVRTASLACPGLPEAASTVRAALPGESVLPALVVAGAADTAAGSSAPETADRAVLRRLAADRPSSGATGRSVTTGDAELALAAGEGAALDVGGALAPGALAGQVALVTSAGGRGLALTACTRPGETQWLLGGGGTAGRVEEIVLSNPGQDPVQVDVQVHDEDGPVEVSGGRGIVVPPGQQVVRLLDALAPGAVAPAVGVTSRGGPVTAHLTDHYRDGTTDLGLEVVASSALPARDLVVPALPEGGTRVLRLVAPEAEALVELRALTGSGAATPSTPAVRVPAGATVDLPLEDLPEGAVGLRLRSDQPVTAAAVLRSDPTDDEPLDPQDSAASTGSPDQGASTASAPPSGDAAVTTSPPDGTAVTTAPPGGEQGEPVRRPAGDLAWVSAQRLTTDPSGLALPSRGEIPDGQARLALSVVDGTTVDVVWLGDSGTTSVESVQIGNDTTTTLDVPEDARAVWVRPTGPNGVVSSMHVSGSDGLGRYVAASALPPVPWGRDVVGITRLVP